MAVVAIISALKTDLSNTEMFDIVKQVSLTFMFNIIVGIPGGLSWMFGTDLYGYLKKLAK